MKPRIPILTLILALSIVLTARHSLCNELPGKPKVCKPCEEKAGKSSPGDDCDGKCDKRSPVASSLSIVDGNVTTDFHVASARSSTGPTLDMTLTYNSMHADFSTSSIMPLDTGMGYGWTHSYDQWLTFRKGFILRFDGQGGVVRYALQGSVYVSSAGYFETITANLDGSYTMRDKHGNRSTFAIIPNTLFQHYGGGNIVFYRLVSFVNPVGEKTRLHYDANGFLADITDPYDRQLVLNYDITRKLVKLTDPLGRCTKLEYVSGKLVKITDPATQSVKYAYAASGVGAQFLITQKTDRDGRIFKYVYNAQKKPTAILDGAGAAIFTFSNTSNWSFNSVASDATLLRVYIPSTTTVKDGNSRVWKYDYDSEGHVMREVAPDGVTLYEHDPVSMRLKSRKDANGHTTEFTHDAMGNLIARKDALGFVTSFTYEPTCNKVTSMTDSNGRTTHWEYDLFCNLIKEIDPLGFERTWTPELVHGNIISETDKRTFITTHDYNLQGNRIKTVDAAGREFVNTFDVVGNRLSASDCHGNVTQYHYDLLDRVDVVTDPAGNTTQYVYDGEGDRTLVRNRRGVPTMYAYDLRRRMTDIVDGLGGVTHMTYDGNDNRLSSMDPNHHTTFYLYDNRNRLIRTTDPIGCKRSMTFDPDGNRTSSTDGNGNVTRYTYDALDRLDMTTDPLGFQTRTEYDMTDFPGIPGATGPTKGSSLVTKRTDGNGKVIYYAYDGLDRMIAEIRKQGDTAPLFDGDDAVTRYAYDPDGNRVAVQDPNQNIKNYIYDPASRLIRIQNAAGDTTLIAYDCIGNLVTSTAPNGNVVIERSDNRNRVVEMSDSIGLVGRYTYDPEGNQLTSADGNGNTTQYQYDALDRNTHIIDALGAATAMQYDPTGNLIATTDRNGHVTSYQYDTNDRRTVMTDALSHKTKWTYDCENMIRLTDANNHATNYVYDAKNQLTLQTYPDVVPNTRRFFYDAVGNRTSMIDQKLVITSNQYDDLYRMIKRSYLPSMGAPDPADNFQYDLGGRLIYAERAGWVDTFAYDGANRVIDAVQDGKSVRYAYNIPGRTRTIRYPSLRVVRESMDPRSRLNTIDEGAATPLIAGYDYDLGNRVINRGFKNGTMASYSYDADNRLTSLEHTSGMSRIVGFGYAYDAEGNKLAERKRHLPDRSESYLYDVINRLIHYRSGPNAGLPATQTDWTLDAVGNWPFKVTDGVPESRMHGEANEITAIQTNGNAPFAVVSDDNGNTVEDNSFFYSYDLANRLVGISKKTLMGSDPVGEYQYDALGRRVRKNTHPSGMMSPVETIYFYDNSRIVEEQGTLGGATYVYGNYIDEVLSMDRDGHTYYYHQNALFSPHALTDSAGARVEGYLYDAYGRQSLFTPGPNGMVDFGGDDLVTPSGSSAIGNPYMFTGRELDSESNLYYYRARAYDPSKGRFLQRDPLEYIDSWNLYQYVQTRPSFFLDPGGTKDVCAGGAWTPAQASQTGNNKGHDKRGIGFLMFAYGYSVDSTGYYVCDHCCDSNSKHPGARVTDSKFTASATVSGEVSAATWGGNYTSSTGFQAYVWVGFKGAIGAFGTAQGALQSDECNDIKLEGEVCGTIGAYGSLSVGGEASFTLWHWFNANIGVTGTATVTASGSFCFKYNKTGWSISKFDWNRVHVDLVAKGCFATYGCFSFGFGFDW